MCVCILNTLSPVHNVIKLLKKQTFKKSTYSKGLLTKTC